MGMLDQECMFSDGQTVTATGDTPSTNVYDFLGGTNAIANNGVGDIGMTGEKLFLNVRVRNTVTSGGAATVQAVWQQSPDNVTYTDVSTGIATPVASLVAGYDLLRIQPPILTFPGMQRYGRFVYRVAVAALTGGTFDAYVSNTIQRNFGHSAGYSF